MPRRLRLLMTGIGSLVGQNFLDILESRRDFVEIIGTNAAPDSPRLFRCDRVHLVPRNDAPEYAERLLEIIRREEPDLVLPGRDPDVTPLALLVEQYPELAARVVVGRSQIARVFEDKFATWEFAQRHGLPFAETICSGPGGDKAVQGLMSRYRLPYIAKPRRGSGSLGVRVVVNEGQLQQALTLPDYVIQPFLGGGADVYLRSAGNEAGVTFFSAPPDPGQYASQCVIDPKGNRSTTCCTRCVMIMGRAEEIFPAREPGFQAVTERFAAAIAREGWRGSFNLQCRRESDGTFVGFEINGRMTGGTCGRFHLGFDEIGEIVRLWSDPTRLPCYTTATPARGKVVKTLVDNFLSEEESSALLRDRTWNGPSIAKKAETLKS